MSRLVLSRRQVLRGLAWLSAWFVPGSALAARRRSPLGHAARVLFADLDAARVIGTAYLETALDLQWAADLPEWGTRSELRDWLQRRARADFESGNIVRVRGCWLARSEARLCAALVSDTKR